MNETSPQVAKESQILKIPLFVNNPSTRDSTSSPFTTCESTNFSQASLTLSKDQGSPCQCPHVLAADDDAFQDFYYQVLFQRAIDFGDLPFKKKDFKLNTFGSGEELLKKFYSIQKCGCNSCLLVITDFDMGKTKLNGISTALNLRRNGFKGPLILRTSDTAEDLSKKYPGFNKLLEDGIIDNLQDKNSHTKTKEAIYALLRKELKKMEEGL